MTEIEQIKDRLEKLGNDAPPEVIEANRRRLLELSRRWIEPDITAGFARMPAAGWVGGLILYRAGKEPVTFYSQAELEGATILPE